MLFSLIVTYRSRVKIFERLAVRKVIDIVNFLYPFSHVHSGCRCPTSGNLFLLAFWKRIMVLVDIEYCGIVVLDEAILR